MGESESLKALLPGIVAAYRLGASNAVAENKQPDQAAIVRTRGFQLLRNHTNIILLTTEPHNLPTNSVAHTVTR